MDRMSELRPEDYDSVDRAGHILHERGWRKAFTLDEMMRAWERLVAQIESGYDGMADEYTNDLACRDWLAAAWPLITDRGRATRKPELEALDMRFLAATGEDNNGDLSRFYRIDPEDGWWWRRLPIRRFGDFAHDLRPR